MAIEEAVKIIKSLRFDDDDVAIALQYAIKALEKQIPKREARKAYRHVLDMICDYDGRLPTGICDKNGKEICTGDKVNGLFLFGMGIEATCVYSPPCAAFGLEYERGDTKEFLAFCQMCNVEYEIIESEGGKEKEK